MFVHMNLHLFVSVEDVGSDPDHGTMTLRTGNVLGRETMTKVIENGHVPGTVMVTENGHVPGMMMVTVNDHVQEMTLRVIIVRDLGRLIRPVLQLVLMSQNLMSSGHRKVLGQQVVAQVSQ